MSSLLLQPSRSSQPQGGAQIAPKWAQKFPVLVATGSSGFTNLVNGLPPALGSTANFSGSSVGIGASGSASSTTSSIGFEDYAFGGTTPITVIAFSDARPSANRSFLAQGTEVILRVSSVGTGVEFILNSFSTNDRTTAVADSRSTPGFFAAGTYGPSGKLRAYANTAMAEVTPTGSYANSAELFTAIYTQGLNQLFDKRLALLAIFRSELSPAELRELSANPWQLFKPVERRIWVPASTGGPTYATASASSAFSVRGFVSSSQASDWSVRAHVGAAGASAWSVRNHAVHTATASYTVRNQVSASALAAFSVQAAGLVSATSSAAWTVRNHTTASASAASSVRNFASASATSAFSVLASGLVTASRSAAWSVRNAVAASAPASFSVRNYASRLQAGAWSVRSAVAATRSAAWSVTAYVWHTTGAAWSVDGSAAPWPAGRADQQHLAVVPFAGLRAMVPAADLRAAVPSTGVRAIVQQEAP